MVYLKIRNIEELTLRVEKRNSRCFFYWLPQPNNQCRGLLDLNVQGFPPASKQAVSPAAGSCNSVLTLSTGAGVRRHRVRAQSPRQSPTSHASCQPRVLLLVLLTD